MRFMCFEWRAFSQDDLEAALESFGIDIDTFSYQFTGIHEDEYLERNLKKVLKQKDYDAVISWNFWPIVSEVCYQLSIPYISWVYDCPISYPVIPWIMYDTNQVFMFDSEEYKNAGVKNLYHHALAVNTERIDAISLSAEDKKRYTSDVSFLGSMYDSDYDRISAVFPEYERGYLESAVTVEREFQGIDLFGEIYTKDHLKNLKTRLENEGIISVASQEMFDDWLRELWGKEVTRRDRISFLTELGNICDTRYYSYKDYPEIYSARSCGVLNYKDQMFKMFKASKINLNITYRLITKGIPLRVLDIMAAGGFVLTNMQEEIVESFVLGEELVCYQSKDEITDLVKYYLENDTERKKIAEKGHEAVKRFDYVSMLGSILETVFPGRLRTASP